MIFHSYASLPEGTMGHPQSSSIFIGCSTTKTIHLGTLPMEIPVWRCPLKNRGFPQVTMAEINGHATGADSLEVPIPYIFQV